MATTLQAMINGTHGGTYTLGTVTGNGTYNLSDRTNYIHIGNDGFGLPEMERYSVSGPYQDGITDQGYKLGPRKIQLVLNLIAATESAYWARREELMHIFRPRPKPVILQFTNPVRSYYIDCFVEGGLTFSSSDKQGNWGHKVTIQLVAPDPLFYVPTVRNSRLLSGASSGTTTTITYNGNYKSNPVVVFNGPLTNPVLSAYNDGNSAIEFSLNLTGYTVAAGTSVVVDTRYGEKTVTLQPSNLPAYDKLTSSSDLDFAVLPNVGGPRFITSASGTTSASYIDIYYQDKYVGF